MPLARANVRFADSDGSPGREQRFRNGLPAVMTLLARALALKPDSSSAYAERGYVNAFSNLSAAEADYRKALELLKLGALADRPHTGRHRAEEITSELDEPQERARVVAHLRARGIDIARAPSEALADFIESCAPGADPARDPAFRERGRYSKRKKEHAGMMGRG